MARARKVDARAWQDFVKPMPSLAVGPVIVLARGLDTGLEMLVDEGAGATG